MSSAPALVSSTPATVAPPPPRQPHRGRLVLRPMCASSSSCGLPPGGGGERYRSQTQTQPRLVAAQSPPPLAAAGAVVPRNIETGLALLLVVLAAVMSFSLSFIILSFSTCRALQKLEMKGNRLARVVAEEVPGTLSALKLSFLEIHDLTSQLTNLRKRLTVSRFGRETSTKSSSRTG